MREAGLPTFIGDLSGGALVGRGLGVPVDLLISWDRGVIISWGRGVGRDPSDGDLVVSGCYAGADLRGRDCEALPRAEGVRPDPVDGCHWIGEDGVPPAALLSFIERAQGPVNRKDFRVKFLLVGPQMEAMAGLPRWGPPDACRSHATAVQPLDVGPDCVAASPLVGCYQGPVLSSTIILPGK